MNTFTFDGFQARFCHSALIEMQNTVNALEAPNRITAAIYSAASATAARLIEIFADDLPKLMTSDKNAEAVAARQVEVTLSDDEQATLSEAVMHFTAHHNPEDGAGRSGLDIVMVIANA